MAVLELTGLHKRFTDDGGRTMTALDMFSLTVPDGAFGVLLGASGCGKSTVLNSVAGLVQPDSGSIAIGDRVVFERADGSRKLTNVPPDHREIGMVFQSYALWPHMRVFDNVAFPLRSRGERRADVKARVDASMDVVRCAGLLDRYPSELSGGQQQRIALARAIVGEPDVVLFDEPLSNLDANLRSELRDELAMLHQRIGFTALYVTHDQAEALSLGTFVAVMREGKIEQADAPEVLYDHPASAFVASFFGSNRVDGTVLERTAAVTVRTEFGVFSADPVRDNRVDVGDDVTIAVHPHRIEITPTEEGEATVRLSRFAGTRYEFHVVGPTGSEVRVFRPSALGTLAVGTRVRLSAAATDVSVYGTLDDGGSLGADPVPELTGSR